MAGDKVVRLDGSLIGVVVSDSTKFFIDEIVSKNVDNFQKKPLDHPNFHLYELLLLITMSLQKSTVESNQPTNKA